MIIDGKDAVLAFNGATVGKIESFDMTDAVTTVREFAKLDGTVDTLPNGFRRGQLILNLLRDSTDAGQIAMQVAQSSPPYGAVVDTVLTLNSGQALNFKSFVVRLPYIGSESGTGTARVILQIASDVI